MDSQQYDARLCGAQLIVLQGDLKQLQKQSTIPKHKQGYRQRIAGALGTLNWLCRQYTSLHQLDSEKYQKDIKQLQGLIGDKQWEKALLSLPLLIDQLPQALKGLRAEDATPKAISTAKEVYKIYCQACHKQPDLNQERPAYSLFQMAKGLAEKEFIARMIVGVHGTPEIALQNPLTDDDIAGMTRYFLRGD